MSFVPGDVLMFGICSEVFLHPAYLSWSLLLWVWYKETEVEHITWMIATTLVFDFVSIAHNYILYSVIIQHQFHCKVASFLQILSACNLSNCSLFFFESLPTPVIRFSCSTKDHHTFQQLPNLILYGVKANLASHLFFVFLKKSYIVIHSDIVDSKGRKGSWLKGCRFCLSLTKVLKTLFLLPFNGMKMATI